MAMVINATAMATCSKLMNFVSCSGKRRLKRPLIPRYAAAKARAYQVSVAGSRSYMSYSARKKAPAFKSGRKVSVTEGPGNRVERP